MDAAASELRRTWLAAIAKLWSAVWPVGADRPIFLLQIFLLQMSSLNKANRSINR